MNYYTECSPPEPLKESIGASVGNGGKTAETKQLSGAMPRYKAQIFMEILQTGTLAGFIGIFLSAVVLKEDAAKCGD